MIDGVEGVKQKVGVHLRPDIGDLSVGDVALDKLGEGGHLLRRQKGVAGEDAPVVMAADNNRAYRLGST